MDEIPSTSTEQGQCGVCYLTGPLTEIQNHFMENHVDNDTSPSKDGTENKDESANCAPEQFRWSPEDTLLLIRLVEKYQKDFEEGLKKKVWLKIASEMSKACYKTFTFDQVDTKWKGLKKMYKSIRDHNKKSGNSIKRWQFFNAMDGFMSNKPEMEPVATCSSVSAKVSINEAGKSDENHSPTSTQVTKRKRKETATQKRHKEKMTKYDQFLKLFKLSVENQIGQKIEDADAE